MSGDSRPALSDLEERWRRSRSDEDERAWLTALAQERGTSLSWDSYLRLSELSASAASEHLAALLTHGHLSIDSVRLAAYCAHEAAQLAAGVPQADNPVASPQWLSGLLANWGRFQAVRHAVTAVRLLEPRDSPLQDVVFDGLRAIGEEREDDPDSEAERQPIIATVLAASKSKKAGSHPCVALAQSLVCWALSPQEC